MNVFMSYAQTDSEFALALRKAIEDVVGEVTIEDPVMAVEAGEAWAKSVERKLGASDALLVVIPKSGSRGANNVYFETGIARQMRMPILAVMPAEGGSDRVLPTDLAGLLYFDASSDSATEIARRLAPALQSGKARNERIGATF
jgi:predicted nucleotide-binding protein